MHQSDFGDELSLEPSPGTTDYTPRVRDLRLGVTKRRARPRFADPLDLPATTVDHRSAELAAGGRQLTYRPARYEAVWLEASLRSFFEQELVTDVLAIVRGGKEANVYRCAAHPSTGETYLAVKVYRPRQFRNLSNDREYREGRELVALQGGAVRNWHRRVQTALSKKSAFGTTMLHTSWVMHEYTTLQQLHELGGDVPRPLAANENAIAMGYIGDGLTSAPALREVELERSEALPLFERVMANVEMLLREGLIHGDLSAYNVLYWQGRIALIDFPQVVVATRNPSARSMLARDVSRICGYFRRFGVKSDEEALTASLWERYVELGPSQPQA